MCMFLTKDPQTFDPFKNLDPDLIRLVRWLQAKRVLFWLKDQVFRVHCVINKQYREQRDTARTPTPIPCPPFEPKQQFKLHRFCFFGQGQHLWESKLGVTLQVRLVWDMSGDSVIWGDPLQKEGGEIACVRNGLHSWPRRSWLNIMDSFPLLSSENHDSNLMLPPLNMAVKPPE